MIVQNLCELIRGRYDTLANILYFKYGAEYVARLFGDSLEIEVNAIYVWRQVISASIRH